MDRRYASATILVKSLFETYCNRTLPGRSAGFIDGPDVWGTDRRF